MGLRPLGVYPPLADGARVTASGNTTINLAKFAIGTDGTGLGVIAANTAKGVIPSRPTDGNPRSITITIDNTAGSAAAYLARPEWIPATDNETQPYSALVVAPGQIVTFDERDLGTWSYILRLLDGASVSVVVEVGGMGWSS